MRRFFLYMAISITLCGCVHNPPNYPGAPGSAIDPEKYINSQCPNFSGTYEGVGHWIAGDGDNQWLNQTLFFDMVFPSFIRGELSNLQMHYSRQGMHHTIVPPDFADVKEAGERSVTVTMRYRDKSIGSYHSDFKNKQIFVCLNGKLIWGGEDEITGRSEFGPNTGSRSFEIYKDENGNLIHKRKQQVNMNMAFGIIPTGTAEYVSTYRFKKISN